MIVGIGDKSQAAIQGYGSLIIRFDIQPDQIHRAQQGSAQTRGNFARQALAAVSTMGGDIPERSDAVCR